MTRPRPAGVRVGPVVAVAVVAALLLGGSVWWFASGRAARQGYAAAGCPPVSSTASSTVSGTVSGTADVVSDAAFEARLARAVLPVGPVPLAPRTALVCRYSPTGQVSGLSLDPARTAELAAAVAAPLDGYPADALAAKRIPELTDAQVAANAAPPCTAAAPRTVIRFTYPTGPEVIVEVQGAPCASLTNQRLTIRTPARVTQALEALPRLD